MISKPVRTGVYGHFTALVWLGLGPLGVKVVTGLRSELVRPH